MRQIVCLSANKKTKTYSECAKHWADYIEGNATKPSSPLIKIGENEDRINYHKKNYNYQISSISGKTLISENNPELACNKPVVHCRICLLYTSPSPRDGLLSRMPSSA